MDAKPIETATEMVSAKHSTMVMIMTTLIAASPVPCGVGSSRLPNDADRAEHAAHWGSAR
jgi:hypothetical protein